MLLPPEVSTAIQDIIQDHDSGARQLALKALRALQSALSYYFPPSRSPWRDIVNCAWHISRARPSMKAAIQTAILRVLGALQSSPPDHWGQILERHIAEEQSLLENLAKAFAGYFTSLAAGTGKLEMLTLSNSSTMLVALGELFKSPLCPRVNLTILESRPLFEGITLTTQLLATKPPQVTIQLATDAAAAYFASRAEYVLLGADQVDPLTGSVKNKIGSLAVATFAKKHSDGRGQEGKVMCVTSTDKFDERDHRDKEEMEENDPEEVSQNGLMVG